MRNRIRNLCFCGLGSILLALGAWLCVPGPVPFTLQTMVVLLLGHCLGSRRACLCLAVYMALGIMGLPVFSGFSGGAGQLIGPTGGFLLGFFPMAICAGLFRLRGRAWTLMGMLLGQAACYVVGVIWYMGIYARGTVGLSAALGLCVLPYILPDLLKAWLALRLTKVIKIPSIQK